MSSSVCLFKQIESFSRENPLLSVLIQFDDREKNKHSTVRERDDKKNINGLVVGSQFEWFTTFSQFI